MYKGNQGISLGGYRYISSYISDNSKLHVITQEIAISRIVA